ncbi:glycosyltransferase [Ralstonia mannitolilytica]|uniref:D-inositol-3-phosphate glycosyltransferase n=1 Tax=Ralstonia mannitolilytica TaxID=105219 RepID=A0AAJ4ZQE3_9RALS|nr:MULTISPECIES: glycosyltransferase [Ralstonia]MBU9577041.1 glycosyltransferase [Ralstonia mannitolilytica]PLT17799.1 glycosyltransferase family 1 protein [Ralstonia mannitolilytica]CAG2131387.1 D-inositol 3-phosphate glycosyltransferase [Ralstonia mannitolilytica]CAJ0730705.1 D-inositol 3-phosphate glycosyltransferase [Ralstonia mannitolilytica]SUE24932.1 D-inositol-3-phosphate glycosyltransferase [Ralstonia mannitolilytica]
MRIAMVSEHASPLADLGGVDCGGQNVYVRHVARQLARLGHQVDVFTRRERPSEPEIVPFDAGCRVIHVPAGPAAVLPKEALLPHMHAFGRYLLNQCARAHAAGNGYDVIHANFFMSGLASLAAAARLRLPLVMTFHALGRVRRLHQGSADGFPDARFTIEDTLVQRAERIIAECPQDQTDLETLYHARPERIDVVPCGFDAAEFAPIDRAQARHQLGVPADAFVVLQLGRMVARKGVDNVIEAIGKLPPDARKRVRLYVVGGNTVTPDVAATPELGRLQAVAAAAGVTEQTVFVGKRGRADLRAWYSACDVFVSTPWYEPFGITPVEAMACGRAVIGADVGGIRSTVRHGRTGFLVPPKDPQALAARLLQLMEQPELCREFGQAGLVRARMLYTWLGVAGQLEKAYLKAIDMRARANARMNGTPSVANASALAGLAA